MLNTVDTFIKLLDASTTALQESAVLDNSTFSHTAIQVLGAVAVELYVSNDGTTFVKYGNDLAGNSWTRLDGFFPYLKVKRANSATEVTVTINRTKLRTF